MHQEPVRLIGDSQILELVMYLPSKHILNAHQAVYPDNTLQPHTRHKQQYVNTRVNSTHKDNSGQTVVSTTAVVRTLPLATTDVEIYAHNTQTSHQAVSW